MTSDFLRRAIYGATVLLTATFTPAMATFGFVYRFPDQYHWLADTTEPFSFWLVQSVFNFKVENLVQGSRLDHALEVALNGDALLGCYIGVIVGGLTSWYARYTLSDRKPVQTNTLSAS